ncbi:MAG TPA: ATP-binding protein [Limnobacter sp.]|nr:ATP-binding protein [Limnobacter sp.]
MIHSHKLRDVFFRGVFFCAAIIVLSTFLLSWKLSESRKWDQIGSHWSQVSTLANNLLQLTYSTGLMPSPTVDRQWRDNFEKLQTELAELRKHERLNSDIEAAIELTEDLRELRQSLQNKIDPVSVPAELLSKRRDLLMGRMVVEAHQLGELVDNNLRAIAERRSVLSHQILYIFGGSILAGLLVLAWFGRTLMTRVFNPLSRIEGIALKMDAGQLNVRTGLPELGDEVHNLGNILDRLAASLARRIDALNQSNSSLAREIDDRKQAEERLRGMYHQVTKSSKLLESAGRMTGVGGWVFDLKTLEFEWSPQVYSIVDAPVDLQIDLQELLTHFPEASRGIVIRTIEHFLKSREAVNIELPFVTYAGREIWVHVFAEMVSADELHTGELGKIYGAFQDISARKHQENQFRIISERAEAANRAKTEFLTNISHEIRTPLNAIMGLGYLLRNSSMTPMQSEWLVRLDVASRRLMDLINDILDLSKIEAGKASVISSTFSLFDLFDGLAVLAKGLAQGKGVSYAFVVHEDVPEVLVGDPLKLRQVLINLLDNAFKFTEAGHVVVRCQCLGMKDGCCDLRFSIADTGIGMGADTLSNLFQAFSQGDNSVSRKYGGTGIGLALSQKLSRLLGSSIQVQSVLGEGSTFSFDVTCQMVGNHRSQSAVKLADGLVIVTAGMSGLASEAIERLAGRFGIPFLGTGSSTEELAVTAERSSLSLLIFSGCCADQQLACKSHWFVQNAEQFREVRVIDVYTMGTVGEEAESLAHSPSWCSMIAPLTPNSFLKIVSEFMRSDTQPNPLKINA